VYADRYAGAFARAPFVAHGLGYATARTPPKSELYQALLPLLNAHRVELLDVPRLTAQLGNLERHTRAGGRDVVDHPPNAHDDVANACAGALVLAYRRGVRCGDGEVQPGEVPRRDVQRRSTPTVQLGERRRYMSFFFPGSG
jgi:hypothetical protein